MSDGNDWTTVPFKNEIKVTIEIRDFETLALLVEFLSKHGFKVKSKDDQTLARESTTKET